MRALYPSAAVRDTGAAPTRRPGDPAERPAVGDGQAGGDVRISRIAQAKLRRARPLKRLTRESGPFRLRRLLVLWGGGPGKFARPAARPSCRSGARSLRACSRRAAMRRRGLPERVRRDDALRRWRPARGLRPLRAKPDGEAPGLRAVSRSAPGGPAASRGRGACRSGPMPHERGRRAPAGHPLDPAARSPA